MPARERGRESLRLHRDWINFGERVIIVPRRHQKREKNKSLRHTAVTRLMRNTGDMKLVAQYLGDTPVRMTRIWQKQPNNL